MHATLLIPFLSDTNCRNFLWDLALSKLYANCLLSTLNARMTIKESSHGSLNQRQLGCGSSGTSGHANNVNVNVNCTYSFQSSLSRRVELTDAI